MVIHRSYQMGPTAPPPDRRSLGRVLVTLDDMRVLMQILDEHRWSTSDGDVSPPAEEARPVFVTYDEGVFTAAEDMRELSNANLRNLLVKCDQTTVHLSPSRAEAIGPAPINDLIENAWARSRQTRKRPKVERGWSSMALAIFIPVFGLTALVIYFFAPSDLGMEAAFAASPFIFITALVVILIFLVVPIATEIAYRDLFGSSRTRNYAVIAAFTQDELRKQESSRSKWPVISATIGVLALIVSVTFNLINLMRH